MEITIRLAGLADLPTMRLLFRAYGENLAHGPANICIEGFDREIATLPYPYFILVLAFVNGKPAGCVALKPLPRPGSGEQACEMKRLWVAAAYRGLGLGRKLVLAALGHAKASGQTAIYLDTVPFAMPEANRLYVSLGFEEVTRYNTNPVADVVFFRRSL